MNDNILIHVVEDDLEQADTLMHFLESDGRFQAALSQTAEEALDYHEHHPPPTLVICDINLEEDNKGYTVVSDCSRREIPVIVLTGRPDRQKEQAAAAIHGAIAYLSKPYASQVLRAMIENVLLAIGELKTVIRLSQRLAYDPGTRDLTRDGEILYTFGELQGRALAVLGSNGSAFTPLPELTRELYGEDGRDVRQNAYSLLRSMRYTIAQNELPLVIESSSGRRSKGYRLVVGA